MKCNGEAVWIVGIWRERYTCNRPLSSRSPRSFTKTTSSRRRRTRSRGSAMEVLVSSSGEAIGWVMSRDVGRGVGDVATG